MRIWPLLAAVLTAASLSACLPVTSKVPAGTSVGFKIDPTLLGTWIVRDKDGDKPAYLHFVGKDDGSMIAVLVESAHGQNQGELDLYKIEVAQLGQNHIVNAQEIALGKEPAGENPLTNAYVLLCYRAGRPGRIAFYVMEDAGVAAAIKAGKIAGRVDPGQDGDVHVTAGAAALDKFLASPQASGLFKKPLFVATRIQLRGRAFVPSP
ncbi:MAG TPA: hypothetical protein VGM17_14550 [Rhizomicrobium sp.]|jgi:hypothetical protein